MTSLTEEQKVVVDHIKGPLLVLSGAGTGKTHTVISRVENLIVNHNVDPSKILCITFTNKAAKEMKQRLKNKLNRPSEDFSIFTFHSFCNYWLKRKGKEINLPSYRILDPDEMKALVWDIAKNEQLGGYDKKKWFSSAKIIGNTNIDELEAKYLHFENKKLKTKKVKLCLDTISKLGSNVNLSINGAARHIANSPDHIHFIENCVKTYYSEKKKKNLLDFDDLELRGIELLKATKIAYNYEYVLVDETQDSSNTDFELIKQLAPHKNIIAVGDGKQSIYLFRGSSSSNLQKFIDHFGADVAYLTHNFRSDKAIIELANNTMKNHPDKDMLSTSDKDGHVAYLEFKNQKEELDWIIKSIQSLTK